MFSKDVFSAVFNGRIIILFIVLFIFSACKDKDKFLSVSEDKMEIPAEGNKYPLLISSNMKWTVSSADAWVKPSETSGKGDAELTLTVSSNTTKEDRSTTITISAGSEVEQVEIVQRASYLTLSIYELVFDTEGNPLQVSVNSNYKWSVIKPETASWCEVDVTEGEGDMVVTLTPVPYVERVRRGTDHIVFSCFNTASELAIRQEIENDPPEVAELLTPRKGEVGIDIPVMLNWNPVTDPDGDEVGYTVYISTDGSEWIEVVSQTYETFCRVTTEYLDEYSTYFWKVVAWDEFGGESESSVSYFITGASHIYEDGEVIHYQSHSSSSMPVHLVVLGDGFILEDYEIGGAFDKAAETAIEAFFSVEPYPTYRDYFSVYKVAAYSKERGATIKSDFDDQSQKKQVRETIFGCVLDGGKSTGIDCTDKKVFEYVRKIPAIPENELARTTIILIVNLEVYAGTTIMWEDGKSIAMCPMGETFEEIVYHEAGGHGFGRLLDEYIYYPNESLSNDNRKTIIEYRKGDPWWFGANLSITAQRDEIHWNHYFGREGYEAVDIYEGGYFYGKGIWRPEYNSCMNNNVPYFNAPSREAIVRRIMDISGKGFDDREYYYKDQQRSYSAPTQRSATRNTYHIPLAPPILK